MSNPNNLPEYSSKLKQEINLFIKDIQSLTHKLADDPSYLKEVSSHIITLKNDCKIPKPLLSSETLLKENIKDAEQIITTIFSQPLSIPDAPQNISLLNAAENYAKENTPDLSKIMHVFVEYPDPTQRLIEELQILSTELDVQE